MRVRFQMSAYNVMSPLQLIQIPDNLLIDRIQLQILRHRLGKTIPSVEALPRGRYFIYSFAPRNIAHPDLRIPHHKK